jgi:hypothetical protein
MKPDSKILTHDFYGNPARFKRVNLARICTTFEISSIMKEVKEDGDYSRLAKHLENGFDGYINMTDDQLSKHWIDIREDYVGMLKNEELVSEDDISYEMIKDETEKSEAITRLEDIQNYAQHDPRTIPVILHDWQHEDEIDENAPEKIEAFIEISSDRVSFTEGTSQDNGRYIAIELQDGNLRVLSFENNGGAPMKTTVPMEGLITNDDHDYLIETSALREDEEVMKGPGQ